jgi:hypothetical protein
MCVLLIDHAMALLLSPVGGANHCNLHCRLAKFRGLMYQVKYSPVIGWESHTFVVWSQSKSPGYGSLPANHSAVFHLVHQTTTEFCQTPV